MKDAREENGNAQILIQTIIAGHCTNTGNKCTEIHGKAGNKLGKKNKQRDLVSMECWDLCRAQYPA